jgi:uncharacterized membrane protein
MPMKFDIVSGETEHVSLNGSRRRNATILMRVQTPGRTVSLSLKAVLLGIVLGVCQLLDGVLTYTGLRSLGIKMEGNSLLQELMHAYGLVIPLFIAKLLAIVGVVTLVCAAHRRKWIRPMIVALSAMYLALAVVPWSFALWYRL